jgi:hypothetical protein
VISRSVAVWVLLLVVASVNGFAREALLIPRVGDVAGRAISTLALSALILLLAWLTVGWIHPRTPPDAWRIGAVWTALTLAFEFLAGHYLFGNPWARLLEDYNILGGRIWILVLITTAIAPWVCAYARGLFASAPTMP